MAECMEFPDTMEEYMEQYKIVDTEQIYTNGIEMIPLFRMKQWFEHMPERKKGKWECDRLGTFICSCCGSGYKEQPTLMGRPMFEWCPMCGADMRNE